MPWVTNEITKYIENCTVCHNYSESNTKKPLTPYPIPKLPWNEVGIDFCHILLEDYLVLIDYHSKFIEVRKMHKKYLQGQ